ncbi:MAG: hypothetical protein HHAS10_02850 [Candidatus Altimarinota bacterium]
MELLYSWFAIAALFLIIELITSTFYGLSLSFAAGVTALYILVSHESAFSLNQAGIFVVASAIFAYILPRMLISKAPDVPQGTDKYVGEKRTVKKVGGDLKISLDGVDYLVESDDEINSGDKVEVLGHKGASMKVKKI